MFSFIEKCFPKFIAISQFQPFLGSLGIFIVIFAKKEIFGDVISLRGLEKMFSFIEKVFQPFIFGDVIDLRELKKCFLL